MLWRAVFEKCVIKQFKLGVGHRMDDTIPCGEKLTECEPGHFLRNCDLAFL